MGSGLLRYGAEARCRSGKEGGEESWNGNITNPQHYGHMHLHHVSIPDVSLGLHLCPLCADSGLLRCIREHAGQLWEGEQLEP